MNVLAFSITSFLYMFCLAIIDSVFNRLVFREHRQLPYHAAEKQSLYTYWEWKVIGVVLLFILPVLIPSLVAYAIGGRKYLELYLIIAAMVPWDSIFGKLVFNDWFGDTPSIALPVIGWVQTPLARSIYLRCLICLTLTIHLTHF